MLQINISRVEKKENDDTFIDYITYITIFNELEEKNEDQEFVFSFPHNWVNVKIEDTIDRFKFELSNPNHLDMVGIKTNGPIVEFIIRTGLHTKKEGRVIFAKYNLGRGQIMTLRNYLVKHFG